MSSRGCGPGSGPGSGPGGGSGRRGMGRAGAVAGSGQPRGHSPVAGRVGCGSGSRRLEGYDPHSKGAPQVTSQGGMRPGPVWLTPGEGVVCPLLPHKEGDAQLPPTCRGTWPRAAPTAGLGLARETTCPSVRVSQAGSRGAGPPDPASPDVSPVPGWCGRRAAGWCEDTVLHRGVLAGRPAPGRVPQGFTPCSRRTEVLDFEQGALGLRSQCCSGPRASLRPQMGGSRAGATCRRMQ